MTRRGSDCSDLAVVLSKNPQKFKEIKDRVFAGQKVSDEDFRFAILYLLLKLGKTLSKKRGILC